MKWVGRGIARILFRLEGFNGYGYHSRGINSPYLWSGSTAYGPPEERAGRFIADGVLDPNKVDPQLGVAVILKELIGLDPPVRSGGLGKSGDLRIRSRVSRPSLGSQAEHPRRDKCGTTLPCSSALATNSTVLAGTARPTPTLPLNGVDGGVHADHTSLRQSPEEPILARAVFLVDQRGFEPTNLSLIEGSFGTRSAPTSASAPPTPLSI
jgi:hypothetical protein